MDNLVIVRGGGDIASGVIATLHKEGFKVLVLEQAGPTAIRRYVSFSEAVWQGQMTVEGMTAYNAKSLDQIKKHLLEGHIVVAVDELGDLIQEFPPIALVDAMLKKKNIMTTLDMASFVVGIGPGHEVGRHCHCAIESNRGPDLGKRYYSGSPEADTGIPGQIEGVSRDRVYYAKVSGQLQVKKDIDSMVNKGDIIALIGEEEVRTAISGLVRGMIRDGTEVKSGLKIADVDPRSDLKDACYKISDKATCIGQSVLKAIRHYKEAEND